MRRWSGSRRPASGTTDLPARRRPRGRSAPRRSDEEMSMTETENALRAFIAETYLYDGDAASLASDRSLIEEGLIDSTGVLELVSFLEERFGIEIADSEIVPDN